MDNVTTCTNCGQVIKKVVEIGGKPYGTTCGSRKLGLTDFPSWFKGGDWDKAKEDHDKLMEVKRGEFEKKREVTKKHWDTFVKLCQASLNARRKYNKWLEEFINSIALQLGYFRVSHGMDMYENGLDTFEKAEKNWGDSTFPYLHREPKDISELSPKQQEILERYL